MGIRDKIQEWPGMWGNLFGNDAGHHPNGPMQSFWLRGSHIKDVEDMLKMVNELKQAVYFPSAPVQGKPATKPRAAPTSGSPKNIHIPAVVKAQENPMPGPARARSNCPDFLAAPVSPVKDFRTFLAEENPGHHENDFVASMVEAGQTDFDKIGSILGYYTQGQRYDTLYTQYLKQSSIQHARKPVPKVPIRPKPVRASSPDNKKMHTSPEQKQAEPQRAHARSHSPD